MAIANRPEGISGGIGGSNNIRVIRGKPVAIINGDRFTKGGQKVVRSQGGKVSRAIENKYRKDAGVAKGITTGKAKADVRNAKVKDVMNPITKGKNKDWAKEANKSVTPGSSRRAKVKESSINTRMEKHPLVRNAGNASSETKYRTMRGKPVPTKKK